MMLVIRLRFHLGIDGKRRIGQIKRRYSISEIIGLNPRFDEDSARLARYLLDERKRYM